MADKKGTASEYSSIKGRAPSRASSGSGQTASSAKKGGAASASEKPESKGAKSAKTSSAQKRAKAASPSGKKSKETKNVKAASGQKGAGASPLSEGKRSGGAKAPKASSERPDTAARSPKKRKASASPEDDGSLTNEVFFLSALAASILLFIGNIGLGGSVGTTVGSFFFGLFGIMNYLFPAILFISLVFFFANRKNPRVWKKLPVLILLFIFLCATLHLITQGEYGFQTEISRYYEISAREQTGGGLVGGLLIHIFTLGFGYIGAFILTILGLAICIILLTNKAFLSILRNRGKEAADKATMRREERRRQRNEEREMQLAERKRLEEERRAAIKARRLEAERQAFLNEAYRKEEREAFLRESRLQEEERKAFVSSLKGTEKEEDPSHFKPEGNIHVIGSFGMDASEKPAKKAAPERKKEVSSRRPPKEEASFQEMQPAEASSPRMQREEAPSRRSPREEAPSRRKERRGDGDMEELLVQTALELSQDHEDEHPKGLPLTAAREEEPAPPPAQKASVPSFLQHFMGGKPKINQGSVSYDESLEEHLARKRGTKKGTFYEEEALYLPEEEEVSEASSGNPEFSAEDGEIRLRSKNEGARTGGSSSRPESGKNASGGETSRKGRLSDPFDEEASQGGGEADSRGEAGSFADEIVPKASARSRRPGKPREEAFEGFPDRNPSPEASFEGFPDRDSAPEASFEGFPDRNPSPEASFDPGDASDRELPDNPRRPRKTHRRPDEAGESVENIRDEMQRTQETADQGRLPGLDLVKRDPGAARTGMGAEEAEERMKLEQVFHDFGVRVQVTNVSRGPSVTRYEVKPEPGVKVSRILALQNDIKLNLAAAEIRIEAPIPGKDAVGIEVPNKTTTPVLLGDLLASDAFRKKKAPLTFAVGKDLAGGVVVTDIEKMPHLLIAGATGSGKSVCINTLIMSVLYKSTPEQVRMLMIDPKVVELKIYDGIPHLLIPVVTDPKKAAGALNWAVAEMVERYNRFAEMQGVRDLSSYNRRIAEINKVLPPEEQKKPMPRILIIVDELADLMMVAPGEVEDAICRLAQLARAAGLHLVIATQRPSVNVVTGLIKANMPSRIALAVSSGVDSRTIIDMNGAEKLLGKGDMLFYPQGYPKPARVQGAFVSDDEITNVVQFLTSQAGETEYNSEVEEKILTTVAQGPEGAKDESNERDEYFEEAGRFIIEKDKASIGMLQRLLRIGFNRAARIMDQLAEAGVVGPEEGTKPRKILMTSDEFERYLEEY